MAIYITGDIHGDIERLNPEKLKSKGYNLTIGDTLIILGDLMIPWLHPNWSPEDRAKLQTLDNCPFTIAFIDGNHENFEFLNSLPLNDWKGGKIHRLGHNVVHLTRGEVFTIEGCTFFAFGGAQSVDRYERKENLTWWKEEIPSKEEFQYGVFNLLKNYDSKVDYVLTHTIPQYSGAGDDPTCEMLKKFYETTDFKKWFYGHMHRNEFNSKLKLYCLYDGVMRI